MVLGHGSDRASRGQMIWQLELAGFVVLAVTEDHSDYQDASAESRAMQDADTSNPGFLWVQQGGAPMIGEHGQRGAKLRRLPWRVAVAMRGVAALYPAPPMPEFSHAA